MTSPQIQSRILKASRYEKYLYCICFCIDLIGGLFFLYDIIKHQEKWDRHNTTYFGYGFSIFLTLVGILGLLLLSNRFKILTIESSLTLDKKKMILDDLLNKFDKTNTEKNSDLYFFTYTKNWTTPNYNVYSSFDTNYFYLLVQKDWSTKGIIFGDGVIDLFGQTKKFRQNMIDCLTNLIDKNNSVQH